MPTRKGRQRYKGWTKCSIDGSSIADGKLFKLGTIMEENPSIYNQPVSFLRSSQTHIRSFGGYTLGLRDEIALRARPRVSVRKYSVAPVSIQL